LKVGAVYLKTEIRCSEVSAKRVSDSQEVYDGVPSLHDAKAATLITYLHGNGVNQLWRESSAGERELSALRREYDLHQQQHQRNRGRLESQLARHWPEVSDCLSLDSITLETLLIEYGSPDRVAEAGEIVYQQMRQWGRSQLSSDKIEQVIASAQNSLGQPCIEAERAYLQALGKELRHSRLEQRRVKRELEAWVKNDDALTCMRAVICLVTTAVILSCRLDPRLHHCARSYQKAFGLNLKEKSSGRHHGQLTITKRGSSTARRYLYFAALRLINTDPIIQQWYQQKVNPRARKKTIIALMRKLSKALWHVARGERFDANKLLTLKTT
jgi:transposase